MHYNKSITWSIDPVLDGIYEDLRGKHYSKKNLRFRENYSINHVSELSAKTIYYGHTGEPEIVCSILSRNCWPKNVYRIFNRLWKPNILSGPIFDISEGFGKVLEDQIRWCQMNNAEGVFISRQGSGAWQEWASSKLKKMTGVNFTILSDEYLTCDNESDSSCWQKIIYSGTLSKINNWKRI